MTVCAKHERRCCRLVAPTINRLQKVVLPIVVDCTATCNLCIRAIGFSITKENESFCTLFRCVFLNGVCRHEPIAVVRRSPCHFLNGVCRHEHNQAILSQMLGFLNGVCRHERVNQAQTAATKFLNGVCRHEPRR